MSRIIGRNGYFVKYIITPISKTNDNSGVKLKPKTNKSTPGMIPLSLYFSGVTVGGGRGAKVYQMIKSRRRPPTSRDLESNGTAAQLASVGQDIAADQRGHQKNLQSPEIRNWSLVRVQESDYFLVTVTELLKIAPELSHP